MTAFNRIPAVMSAILMVVSGPGRAADQVVRDEPPFMDKGYVYLVLGAPASDFDVNYQRRSFDGEVRQRAFDAMDTRSDDPLFRAGVGARITGNVWAGFDYTKSSGSSGGAYQYKAHLGPFPFIVGATGTVSYSEQAGRAWLGYAMQPAPDTRIIVQSGVFLGELKLQASSPQAGRYEEDAIGAMPLVGIDLTQELGGWGRLRFRGDYSAIGINDVDARSVRGEVSLEIPLEKKWGIGVGYRIEDLDIQVRKQKFDVSGTIRIQGPSVMIYSSFR